MEQHRHGGSAPERLRDLPVHAATPELARLDAGACVDAAEARGAETPGKGGRPSEVAETPVDENGEDSGALLARRKAESRERPAAVGVLRPVRICRVERRRLDGDASEGIAIARECGDVGKPNSTER